MSFCLARLKRVIAVVFSSSKLLRPLCAQRLLPRVQHCSPRALRSALLALSTAAAASSSPAPMAAPRITPRRDADRGVGEHGGWLSSRFTFSFADYYDPAFQSFGALRVLNDDTVAAAGGFPTHSHRDAEIFSYILSGSLSHKDSMGHSETLSRGQVQFTSAGAGISHSEFNGDTRRGGTPVRFLQVWATPHTRGLTPAYQTASFSDAAKADALCQFLAPAAPGAGPPPRTAAALEPIRINADFRAYASILRAGAAVTHELAAAPGARPRRAYVHVPIMPGAAGITLSSAGASSAGAPPPVALRPGDGAFVEGVAQLRIVGSDTAAVGTAGGSAAAGARTEFVLFDFP